MVKEQAYDFFVNNIIHRLKKYLVYIWILHDREKKFIPSVITITDNNYSDIRDIYNYVKSISPLFKLRFEEKEDNYKQLLLAIEKYKVYESYEEVIETNEQLKN